MRLASHAKRRLKTLAYAVGLERQFELHYQRYRWKRYQRTGAVFIHIPKAAGTSVATALYGRRLGHHRVQDLRSEDPVAFDRLFTFTVVRDPVTRFISAFRYLAGRGGNDGTVNHLNRYERWMFEDIDRFATEWLPTQDLSTCNPIFRPQSHFVSAEDIRSGALDHIGRVEDIWAVYQLLAERTNMRKPQLEMRNRSDQQTPLRLSDPALKMIHRIYAEDFHLFRY